MKAAAVSVSVVTLLVACGGDPQTDKAAEAVRASGTPVEGCVRGWSGYGDKYDDPAWKERALALGRWRCNLRLPRDYLHLSNERAWCFIWYEGEPADDLMFPAALQVDGEKSCW